MDKLTHHLCGDHCLLMCTSFINVLPHSNGSISGIIGRASEPLTYKSYRDLGIYFYELYVVRCHVCGDVICRQCSGAERSISVGESMAEIGIV